MRRVGSYGGPFEVAGSERLKQRLSSTPGLHLISSSSTGESGFLHTRGWPCHQDERVVHRTFRAARNFYPGASNLEGVAKRRSGVEKDLFAPVVRERIIIQKSVDSSKHFNDGAAVLLVDGKHSCRPRVNANAGKREGGEAVPEDVLVNSLNDDQAKVVELDKSSTRASSSEEPCNGPNSAYFQRGNAGFQDTPLFKSEIASTVSSNIVGLSCHATIAQFFSLGTVHDQEEIQRRQVLLCSEALPSFDHAAVVVQKHWRAKQARCLVKRLKIEQVVREQQKINYAALVVQKHWRAQPCRALVKYLEMEQVVRDEQKLQNAAVVLQKHWRATQGRCLVKDLKMEQVVKDEQKLQNAAVVLQKHWRAKKGRCLVKHLKTEQVVREEQKLQNAAVVLQKHWRAKQGRCLVKHLKTEQVVREEQKLQNAAVVLQKHWRAKQGRCLVIHLKAEQVAREEQKLVVREEQKLQNAAVVLQKHWRAKQGRFLVKFLRMEQVAGEKQKIDNAAIVLQKHWRAKKDRCLVKHLRLEQVGSMNHTVCDGVLELQKHRRARQDRLFLKHLETQQGVMKQQRSDVASTLLQKQWQAQGVRCMGKHLRTEQIDREQQRIDEATVVIQKYCRARQCTYVLKRLRMEQVVRKHQKIGHAAILLQNYWRAVSSMSLVKVLRMEHVVKEKQKTDHAAVLLQKHWRPLQSRDLTKHMKMEKVGRQPSEPEVYTTDANGCKSKAEVSLEPCTSSSLVQLVDVAVQSVDQTFRLPDLLEKLESGSDSQRHDLNVDRGLDVEFSTKSVGHLQVQNGDDDWNYFAVDHLEECLDTCLSARGPLPSTICGSQHFLPGLDLPGKSEQLNALDQNIQNKDVAKGSSTAKLSITCETVLHMPGAQLVAGEAVYEPNDLVWSVGHVPKMHTDQVTSKANLFYAMAESDISSGPLQYTSIQQLETQAQNRNLVKFPFNQNEKRLKQFAEVFLLQRHIALQQQRAQAAPPFPLPMPSEGRIPSHMVTQPLEVKSDDEGQVGLQNTSVLSDSQAYRLDGRRPLEHQFVCEIDPHDEEIVRRPTLGSQTSGDHTKQVIDRQGPDVVLDMVLLLKQIKEDYGTCDSHLEGENSTWYTPGGADIEEGRPLLDRHSTFMRQDELVKLSTGERNKHMNLPDVSVLLLMFIAMVVYTRTVCKGLLHGARQTHKRV